MAYAERNRAIKALVSKAFAPHKVSVKGSRGTACGWVTVRIGYKPESWEKSRELSGLVLKMIAAAGIRIGTYGYDDPGSDYGFGKTIHVNFERVEG